MERPQAVPNIWYILKIVGWALALEGIAEFYSSAHWHTLLRRLIYLFLDRDPAKPTLPDNWEEWYNS